MNLEEFRTTLLISADNIHPNLSSLENKYLSIEDIVDFAIYEAIKSAYDNHAPQKSLTQHITKGYDSGTIYNIEGSVRLLSREWRSSQYYRSLQQERIKNATGKVVEALNAVDMKDTPTRFAGCGLNDLQFSEIENRHSIPLLKKIERRQICSSKKVSNAQFINMMEEYDNCIQIMKRQMSSAAEILYYSEAYFNLEWHYNIDIIYQIVLEAEKHNFPPFNLDNCRGIWAKLLIPPTTSWFPYEIPFECRMVYKRRNLLPLVFDVTDTEREEIIRILAELYRLETVLKKFASANIGPDTSKEEQADFLKRRQWVWDAHIAEKKWTSGRISYARKIFSEMYLDEKAPIIK